MEEDLELEDLKQEHCINCDYQETTQGRLKVHQQTNHEDLRYLCNNCCDKCDIQATQKRHITIHIKDQHMIGYPCTKCQTVHLIEHPCSKCEYKNKHKGSLKLHIQGQHGDGNNIGFQVKHEFKDDVDIC